MVNKVFGVAVTISNRPKAGRVRGSGGFVRVDVTVIKGVPKCFDYFSIEELRATQRVWLWEGVGLVKKY